MESTSSFMVAAPIVTGHVCSALRGFSGLIVPDDFGQQRPPLVLCHLSDLYVEPMLRHVDGLEKVPLPSHPAAYAPGAYYKSLFRCPTSCLVVGMQGTPLFKLLNGSSAKCPRESQKNVGLLGYQRVSMT